MGVGAHYEVARLGHASSQGPSSVSCRATAVADPGYLPSPSNRCRETVFISTISVPPRSHLKRDPAPHRRLGVFVAKIRAVAFYLWTLAIAVPLFVIMLLIFPFVMATDRQAPPPPSGREPPPPPPPQTSVGTTHWLL